MQPIGVPIAAHKTEGPTTCLVFLGIELDTIAGELRLPDEKLQRLQSLLLEWGDKSVCTRRELESLVGLLNHACKVVQAERSSGSTKANSGESSLQLVPPPPKGDYAMAGVEDSMIQAFGRWQSAAFLQYIGTPRDQLAAISRQLTTTVSSPAAGLNCLS
jgi:hypothetical protein